MNWPEKAQEIKQSPAEVTKENAKKTTEAITKVPNSTDGAISKEKVEDAKNKQNTSETPERIPTQEELEKAIRNANKAYETVIWSVDTDFKKRVDHNISNNTNTLQKLLKEVPILFTLKGQKSRINPHQPLLETYLNLQWYTIDSDNIKPLWNAKDIKLYPQQDITIIKDTIVGALSGKIKDKYLSSFTKGELVINPMPKITTLATWEWGTTTGFLNESNNARWAFDYTENRKNLQTNTKNIEWWVQNWPLNINVNPIGENILNGYPDSGWSISFTLTQNGQPKTFKGIYNQNSIVWDVILPEWITIQQNIVSISERYKDSSIQVTTNSAKYSEWSYDEVQFMLAIQNGKIPTWTLISPELGKNQLTENQKDKTDEYMPDISEKQKLTKKINYIAEDLKWSLNYNLPVDMVVYGDQTENQTPTKDLPMYNLINTDLQTKIMTKYTNEIQKKQIADVIHDYNQSIQSATNEQIFSRFKNDQTKPEVVTTQKALLLSRCLSRLDIMTDNTVFRNSIVSWNTKYQPKVKLNILREQTPPAGRKWVDITMKSFNYIK